jgi:SAM-dependent methyltransferase
MAHITEDRELSYLGLQAGWTRAMRVHLYRRIGLMGRRRILDIGCADGLITAEIAGRTKGAVTGIDIRPERIEEARRNHPDIAFREADAHDLPFGDGAFDAVITNFTLMWTEHPGRAMAEAARVLKSGGVFLASGEPDYGGRIDEPEALRPLSEAWAGSIREDGGDPFFGRRLKGLMTGSGLRSVEVGVMPSVWEPEAGDELEAYLDCLRYLFSGRAAGGLDIDEIIKRERRAARSGARLVFLPIFWGIGEKP